MNNNDNTIYLEGIGTNWFLCKDYDYGEGFLIVIKIDTRLRKSTKVRLEIVPNDRDHSDLAQVIDANDIVRYTFEFPRELG